MPVECKSVTSVSLSPSGFNHVQLISQVMKNLQDIDKAIETLKLQSVSFASLSPSLFENLEL